MMNEFQTAYTILGVEPGSPKEVVKERYKKLIMAWHPDRFSSDASKATAEEELKKINNAKDLLWKHFDSSQHKPKGCRCQEPIGSQSSGSQSGPGPGRSGNTSGNDDAEKNAEAERKRKAAAAEEEAARRDAERRRRTAEEDQQKKQQDDAGAAKVKEFADAVLQNQIYKEQQLRWKIAKIEGAVLIGLCLFGMVGSGINATVRSWQSNQEQVAANKVDPNDPCAHGNTSVSPPNVILPFIKDRAKQNSTLWKINCFGNKKGGIITGEDAQGKPIAAVYFGPDWTYICQYLVKYDSSSQVSVELWKAPNEQEGKTTYIYDGSHNLTEIRKVNAQQSTLVTGTVERRSGGGFFDIVLQFSGSPAITSKLYQTEDPLLTNTFYLYDIFSAIPKQIDPVPTAVSPNTAPVGISPTTSFPTRTFEMRSFQTGDFLIDKLKQMKYPDIPTPAIPDGAPNTSTATSTGTATGTDEPLVKPSSPEFAPSSSGSPGMDALTKQLQQQNDRK